MANVRMKNVLTGKVETIELGQLLKMIIGELPIAEKVNDEVQFKNGEPLHLNSLELDIKA